MSSTRRTLRGGFVSPSKLPRGLGGRALCRCGCGAEVPPPRRTFATDACVHRWKLRTNPAYQRDQVSARDGGVCALCGVDTRLLRRLFLAACHDAAIEVLPLDDGERAAAGRVLRDQGYTLILADRGDAMAIATVRAVLLGFDPGRGTWWDMDHARPVVEGGGVADNASPEEVLGNLRTLCQPCHKRETAALAARRAAARRTEAAAVAAAAQPELRLEGGAR